MEEHQKGGEWPTSPPGQVWPAPSDAPRTTADPSATGTGASECMCRRRWLDSLAQVKNQEDQERMTTGKDAALRRDPLQSL